MVFLTTKWTTIAVGAIVATGMLVASAIPASARTVYRPHHGKHVNVNINLRGGSGRHHYAYRRVPVVYVARPYRPCTRVRRDGWYRGYPALVSNRVCFNAYGDAFVQRGTKRLVHYY